MRVNYMEQGCCAECGSGNVRSTHVLFGRSGENILAFFVCNECGCEFFDMYECTTRGICCDDDGKYEEVIR